MRLPLPKSISVSGTTGIHFSHSDRQVPSGSGAIEARDPRTNESINVYNSFGKRGLAVWFNPLEQKTVEVTYKQSCDVTNGSYILVTTKPWGRPLKHGVYTLTEHGTKILKSNYATTASANNPQQQRFERFDFMPEHDWSFAWTNSK